MGYRAHGMKVLDAELKRAKRARTSLSVVMFDLDYFKSVNDDYGHLCGDALLTAVGKRMQELLRNSDVKCRYGGEEFLILLPDTPIDGAVHVADVLRQEIGMLSVSWTGETVSTTASVGVAIAGPGELDAKALIGRADAALYRAKHLGRNRVCVDGHADDDPSTDSGHDTASGEAVPPDRWSFGPRSGGGGRSRAPWRPPAGYARRISVITLSLRGPGPSAKAIVPSTTTSSLTRAQPLRCPIRLRSRSTVASMTTTSPGWTGRW